MKTRRVDRHVPVFFSGAKTAPPITFPELSSDVPALPILSGRNRVSLPLLAYQKMLKVRLVVEEDAKESLFTPMLIPFLSAKNLEAVMNRSKLVGKDVRSQVTTYAAQERAFLSQVAQFALANGTRDPQLANELELLRAHLLPAFPEVTVEQLATLISKPLANAEEETPLYHAVLRTMSAQGHAVSIKKPVETPITDGELLPNEKAVLIGLGTRKATQQAVIEAKGPRNPATILAFLKSLYEKLGVTHRSEAVAHGRLSGLIEKGDYPDLEKQLTAEERAHLLRWMSDRQVLPQPPLESSILSVLGAQDRPDAARICQMLDLLPVTFPLLDAKEAGRLKAWAEGDAHQSREDALALALYTKLRSGDVFTTVQIADSLGLTQRPLRDRLMEVPVHAYPSFAPPDRINYMGRVQVIPPTHLWGLLKRLASDASLETIAQERGLSEHPEMFDGYLGEIYGILGVDSRAGAVERARAEGLTAQDAIPAGTQFENDWLGRSRS